MVGNIIASHPPSTPFFLVADSMYTWPSDIAVKHKLVHVSLWTASATVFSINSNLDHDKMPNIEEADAVHLLMTKVVNKAFNQVKNADIILCNTVQELEFETLLALNQKQPTYAIGPINFFNEITKTKVETTLFCGSDCSQWLDSKPPSSVLYISFGSIYSKVIDKKEIMEIAHDILISEVNFIWVCGYENYNDVFPIEFVDHVKFKDRGLIVPWCDQNMVLSKPAVMGFLSHCGWNSIMESIWNGVPMICRPISVDQPMNRKLLVEDWNIGINLCDEGQVVTREEVVSKIKVLMMGEEGIELREEMKKARKLLRNALDENGSSQMNFDQFVHDLKARLYGTS